MRKISKKIFRIKKFTQKAFKVFLIFSLVTSWLFAGWPRLEFKIKDQDFSFPPKVNEAKAFAAVQGTPTCTADTTSASFTVTLPTGVAAGEVLMLFMSLTTTGTVSQTSGGFTQINTATNGTAVQGEVWAKIAAGGDANPVFSFSGSSDDVAIIAIRVNSHSVSNVSTDIYKGTAATGTDAAPNPPSLSPSPGSQDYLWIVYHAADDDDDTSAQPTNYTATHLHCQSANSTSSSETSVADRQLTQSTEDPGTFTIAASEEWVSNTFAIPPSTDLSFTNQGSSANPDINSSTDATSYANSSWTPPTSGMVVVFVFNQTSSDMFDPLVPSVTGNSLTWTLIDSIIVAQSRVSLIAANASGSAAGATTFDFGCQTQAGFGASFFSVSNVYLTDGVVGAFQQVQNGSGTGATSGSITLNSATDSGNRPISAFAHNTNEATTPRTNWTELDDLAGSAPARGFETQYRSDAFETTASASWTTGSDWLGLAAEIRKTGSSSGPAMEQKAFRIRSDDTQTINADAGWAAAVNTNASINPDFDFRIRFEIEHSGGGTQSSGFDLWYSRNDADYQRVPNNATPNGVSSADGQKTVQAIPSAQYTDGVATTDVLTGAGTSSATFTAGTGNEDYAAPSVSFTDPSHTELEFAVMMRKLYDGQGHNADGTTFKFRLRRSGGGLITTYTQTPTVTISNRAGHIGGTPAETPMKYHIKDDNGNLYYVSEYADTSNTPVMLKSTNGGGAWNPADVCDAQEPPDNDLEAIDIDLRSNIANIAVQGPTNDSVFYWRYNVSAHGTPDDWALDETVTTSPTPGQQCVAIGERSATTVIAYCGSPSGADERVYYKIRSGTWGAENTLDSTAGTDFESVGMVRDSTDKIHIVYGGFDGTSYKIYLKSLSTGDVLGSRSTIVDTGITTQGLANRVNFTSPITWNDGGTEKVGVGYRKSDNLLYFRSWNASTESFDTEQAVSDVAIQSHEGGNGQPIADVMVDDTTDKLYALYGDNTTDDVWSDVRLGSSWGTDVERQDAVEADWLHGLVFTHSVGNGGARVVGYIWDNGSGGGTGKTEYDEFAFSTFTQNHYRWYVDNDSTNPTDPWSSFSGIDLAENTALTPLPFSNDPPKVSSGTENQELRLRINFTVGSANLGVSTAYYKLQYRAGTDSDCSTGTWTDVNTGNTWEYASSTVTDGADISAVLSNTTSGKGQEYVKSRPSQVNHVAVNTSEITEYDFHIVGTSGTTAERYLFRVVESLSGGTETAPLSSYTNCVLLYTEPGADNLMRHGNFFSGGVEQGFFWAD